VLRPEWGVFLKIKRHRLVPHAWGTPGGPWENGLMTHIWANKKKTVGGRKKNKKIEKEGGGKSRVFLKPKKQKPPPTNRV